MSRRSVSWLIAIAAGASKLEVGIGCWMPLRLDGFNGRLAATSGQAALLPSYTVGAPK